AAEVGAEGQKALEQSESTFSTLQGDVESGSRWTVAGDGRMLVAVSGSEVIRDDLRAVMRKYIRMGSSESAPSWVALQSVPSRASGTPRIVESQGGYSLDVGAPRRILLGAPTAQAYPLRIPSTPGGSSEEDPPGRSYIQGVCSEFVSSPWTKPLGDSLS
ncbi:hypothetical protein V498_08622, partial [Pseudogymnoascus sp. VKM F-4517 (FW-2822)]